MTLSKVCALSRLQRAVALPNTSSHSLARRCACQARNNGVVFDFRMSRSREGPRQFLKLFQGLLQTDRYSAYDGLGRARVVHAACWAHLRRKLVESVRLNPQDQAAVRLLELVNELFAVDAKAREENMGIAARTEEVDTEINAREGLILGKRRRMGYPHGSVGEIS